MTEPMIRGHVIHHTVQYFRSQCDPDTALRIDASLPLELKSQLRELVPANWYPRRCESELLQAIAHVHGDEESTRRFLLHCGAAMAVGDNEFMKLLMRVLTPELFLKKLSAFWDRDHQDSASYHVDRLDVASRSASIRLSGIAGYTHSALIWEGWIGEIFNEMCGKSLVRQAGWSWSTPAPNEVSFEVTWS